MRSCQFGTRCRNSSNRFSTTDMANNMHPKRVRLQASRTLQFLEPVQHDVDLQRGRSEPAYLMQTFSAHALVDLPRDGWRTNGGNLYTQRY